MYPVRGIGRESALFAREDNCLYTVRGAVRVGSAEGACEPPRSRDGFAEAVTVLEDAFALTREDPDAVGEQRFVTLGLSDQANLLVVVYAYREPDIVRMLSAWGANKRQRELYEKGRG